MDDFSSLAGRREFLKGTAWMGAAVAVEEMDMSLLTT